MALLFPVTVKLREEEADAISELVEQEPLISKAEALIGVSIMGLSVAAQPDGFQRLIGILRQRRQGEESLIPRKSPKSVGVAERAGKPRCA